MRAGWWLTLARGDSKTTFVGLHWSAWAHANNNAWRVSIIIGNERTSLNFALLPAMVGSHVVYIIMRTLVECDSPQLPAAHSTKVHCLQS